MIQPVFQNPLVNELYSHDMRIAHDLIAQILALPRQSLVEDLHTVVYDSISRFAWFRDETEWDETTHNFLLHALILLKELNDETTLPVLLDMLRQDEPYLEYWLNDVLTSEVWQNIYITGFNRLDMLTAFLKEPNRYLFSRSEISVAVSQMALHHPERRSEVVNWYREMFDFYIAHDDDDSLMDEEQLGLMISDAMDIPVRELAGQITQMYQSGMVNPDVAGTLDTVLRILEEPPDPTYKRELLPVYEKYHEIVTTRASYTEEDFFDESDQPWPTPSNSFQT
jgi:hypothetical protein